MTTTGGGDVDLVLAAPLAREFDIAGGLVENAHVGRKPYRHILGTLGKVPVALVQTGVGPMHARDAVSWAITEYSPRQIVLFGFAGGLDPAVESGSMVLADRLLRASGVPTEGGTIDRPHSNVLRGDKGRLRSQPRSIVDQDICYLTTNNAESEMILPPPHPRLELLANTEGTLVSDGEMNTVGSATFRRGGNKPLSVAVGAIVTVDRTVESVAEKESLYRRTGALAVDLEAFAISEVCRDHGVEISVLRAILDDASTPLWPELSRFVDEDGNLAVGRVLQTLLWHPSLVPHVYLIAQRAGLAARALRKALQSLRNE